MTQHSMGEIKNDLLENRRFEKQNFSFSRIKRYFWIKRQEIFTTCLVETSSKVKKKSLSEVLEAYLLITTVIYSRK